MSLTTWSFLRFPTDQPQVTRTLPTSLHEGFLTFQKNGQAGVSFSSRAPAPNAQGPGFNFHTHTLLYGEPFRNLTVCCDPRPHKSPETLLEEMVLAPSVPGCCTEPVCSANSGYRCGGGAGSFQLLHTQVFQFI